MRNMVLYHRDTDLSFQLRFLMYECKTPFLEWGSVRGSYMTADDQHTLFIRPRSELSVTTCEHKGSRRRALPSCASAAWASTQLPNELRGCVPLNATHRVSHTHARTHTHTCTLTSSYPCPPLPPLPPDKLVCQACHRRWWLRLHNRSIVAVQSGQLHFGPFSEEGEAFYFVSLKGIHCGLSARLPTTRALNTALGISEDRKT